MRFRFPEMAWKDTEVAEWIVILLIFLGASFPLEMIYLSETSLGKLFVVVTILFFSVAYHPWVGFVVCVAAIAYYQLDLYHGFVALHQDTWLLRHDHPEGMESMTQQHPPLHSLPKDKLSEDPGLRYVLEVLDGYRPFHPPPSEFTPTVSTSPPASTKAELMAFFRSEHCEHNQLMKKGMEVPYEMADHVFRELRFPSDSAKCNPCMPGCEFSVREDVLRAEESLLRPKSSHDEPIDWNQVVTDYVVNPLNSIASDVSAVGKVFAAYL